MDRKQRIFCPTALVPERESRHMVERLRKGGFTSMNGPS
jgi:hypothetical protein